MGVSKSGGGWQATTNNKSARPRATAMRARDGDEGDGNGDNVGDGEGDESA